MHPLSLADSSAVPPDDSNWITWKGQMVSMLELNDIWGHCDGSDPHPDDPCKAKEWMKAEKVEDDFHEYQACTVCPCCASCDGEADVGEPGVHEIRGQQAIIALRRTWYRTSAQKSGDIALHSTMMCSLQIELHQMGRLNCNL